MFITSMITDQIGRHEVLLPINHKNYNIRENNKMEERENLRQSTDNEGVNFLCRSEIEIC